MTLSIIAADPSTTAVAAATENNEENESPSTLQSQLLQPLSPLGKRKSDLISPSTRRRLGLAAAAATAAGASSSSSSSRPTTYSSSSSSSRGPLSDVKNSPVPSDDGKAVLTNGGGGGGASSTSSSSGAVAANKPRSGGRYTPPTPPIGTYSSSSLPPLSASRLGKFNSNATPNQRTAPNGGGSGSAGSHHRFVAPRGSFHANKTPSKEEVQATDERQASVEKLSEWLAASSAKKSKRPSVSPAGAGGGTTLHNIRPLAISTKPRIKREDVEATDTRRVSVKQLSNWMSNDPFMQKKVRTIRSGSKVIARSRVFEQEKLSKAAEEIGVRAGSVTERQAWLSGAFRCEEEEGKPRPLREEKVRPYQAKKKEGKKKKEEEEEVELKSVRDKKEWLSNAFKKGCGDGGVVATSGAAAAGGGGGGGAPSIRQTKSFERDGDAAVAIHQTKSFEAASGGALHSNHRCGGGGAPSIAKCASADDACAAAADVAGGSGRKPELERQISVVRLYNATAAADDEREEKEEEGCKTVHDKRDWLSNAFKKPDTKLPGSGTVTISSVQKVVPSHSTGGKKVVAEAVACSEKLPPREEEEEEVAVADDRPKKVIEGGGGDAKKDDGVVDDTEYGEGNMSVAERARWLRGAFKHTK